MVNNTYKAVALLLLLVLLASSGLGVVASAPPRAQDGPAGVAGADPAGSGPPAGEGPWVVRAYFDHRSQVDVLAAWREPWEVHYNDPGGAASGGYLVVDVNEAGYWRLLDLGFRVEVDDALTAELNTPNVPLDGQIEGIPGYPCYRTVEETFMTAMDLASDYPYLATWIDVGDSWEKVTPGGLNGYDINVLRLTNANVPGPKPRIFIMSAIHAREYTTAELVTRYAEYLVYNYGVDPDVTWLLDYHEIHLLLVSNPDGRKHAEAGLSWRKNTNENYCGATSNYRGADLNRNFPFEWGCCGGSSGNPCDTTYRGPIALSEPETQAIVDYVRATLPDQRPDDLVTPAPLDTMGVFLDIHSYSELVLWPWGFTSSPAPNATELQTLGRKFAYFNHYTPQQSMSLYPTDGTTTSFAYGELGVAAYTFELGTSFFQNCSTFENTILPDNMPALLYAAKAARTPYMSPSGPDSVDLAGTPEVILPGVPFHLTATVDDTRYYDNIGGEPTQNIAGAEYYIDVPPWVTTTTPVAYPMSAVDGAFDEKVEQVEATVDTTGLPAGRHIVYVRGIDEGLSGTQDGNWGVVSALFLDVIDPGMVPKLEGYVHDSVTGVPLEARITAGPFVTTTHPATGFYHMSVMSGTYDIAADAPGHVPEVVPDVGVYDYQTVQQDFDLDPVCPIFEDDVEAGNAGWTAEGDWAISTEDAHSPSHAWTDSPGTSYGHDWDYAITSPAFDLSDFQAATLTFWHRYDLETYYDHAYVEYSLDGGGSWTAAATYSGTSPGSAWTDEKLVLPALDGQAAVSLRFRLETDDGGASRDGWYVDDVGLYGTGPGCTAAFMPSAGFVSTSPAAPGEPVTFTNTTTGLEPLAFEWDLGDGLGKSLARHPVYTYVSSGTFTVTLVATNAVGSDVVTGTVYVEGPASYHYLYLPIVHRDS